MKTLSVLFEHIESVLEFISLIILIENEFMMISQCNGAKELMLFSKSLLLKKFSFRLQNLYRLRCIL